MLNDKQIYQNVQRSTEEMKEDMEAAKHNFLLSHFFHERGYEDAADLTKHEIAKMPPESEASKVFTYDPKKIFEKLDTAELKHDKTFNEAGTYLQATPFRLAVVAASVEKGSTD